jgi:hypothetical protein
MKSIILLSIVVVFLCHFVHADRTIWYVHPDSTLNSIQAGLDSCVCNDIVLVGPGTYYENIIWPNTQGIHLVSELGSEMTILDGGNQGSVLQIHTAVDTNTVIHGFTIQNGSTSKGGGIFCGPGCSPVISHNTITGNASLGGGPMGAWGGGIYCDSNHAEILGNTFTNNVAWDSWGGIGGGICCVYYNGIISGNTITGNEAAWTGNGGGIWLTCSSPIISDNDISGNIAWRGGGIFCNASSPQISGCVISDNSNDGVCCEPDFYGNPSDPMISFNDIHNNVGYGILNVDSTIVVSADSNWWGDPTGPYHSTLNPGGLGDSVSDYVDFIPWLYWPVGIEEDPIIKPVEQERDVPATIFSGSLLLPEGTNYKVFDIAGRVVIPYNLKPGIYFLEIDDKIAQKIVKIR